MPDWNTRLEVKLGDTTITPISTVSPTFTLNHTPVHSITADNVGLIQQPFTFALAMAIPAIGTAVADLTELALNNTEFTVAVAEKQGTDWSFRAIKFSRCLVTSAAPSNVVIDGAPQATFSCMALSVGIEA